MHIEKDGELYLLGGHNFKKGNWGYAVQGGEIFKWEYDTNPASECFARVILGTTNPTLKEIPDLTPAELINLSEMTDNQTNILRSVKITRPEDKSEDLSKLEYAVRDFEKQFKLEENGLDYYHLVIDYEINKEVCNKIQSIYKNAGWFKVTCKTSSEKGEKPGLTGLQLFRK